MTDTESSSRRELVPGELPERQFAQLLKSVVVPRPIAWESTTSGEGVDNLAPHSFFLGGAAGSAVHLDRAQGLAS